MKQKQISLPLAIIIAGILIAGAIIITKKAPAQQQVAGTPEAMVLGFAAQAGVKEKDVKACIENREMKDRVARDVASGTALGMSGTPYNVVIIGNDRFTIPGAFPQAFFEKVITVMQSGAPRTKDTFASDDLENIYNYVMAHDALPTITGDTASKLAPIDATDHVRGASDAKIMVVEYSDFECPFCQAHHQTMLALAKKYGSDFAWTYRHFPLTSIHDTAQIRAEASECVAKAKGNEAFWKFADANFAQAAK